VIDQPAPNEELLRRIMAVTDAALSHLDTDDLFKELLERLRLLLKTDSAAIMLVDQEARQLVTVAAVGLEDEVRHGFRLDLESGFTGQVATSLEPVVVDQVDPSTMTSAVVRAAGITTLVGVPMLAGGELVGVLHVGTVQPREFADEDVALLRMVADRAALASQANQHRAERAATLALQRSLLPSRLPAIDGVDLAARYLPGHEFGIGGDWYDVFRLPSGEIGVVVGDVSGHGLRSAVVMGRLRSALRSYALIEDDPAGALTYLDRKIRHFESGNVATVLYAKVSPSRDRMVVSAAGHLPPVVARPGRPGELVRLPVDMPVGVGNERPRRSTVIRLPYGSTIVFYTDGLVERRGEIIDEGLRRLARHTVAGRAEAICTSVMAVMDVGRADDDIALLAMHVLARSPDRSASSVSTVDKKSRRRRPAALAAEAQD
jgi:putative methionine-R-sulfoxide reductase with GAF domain